MTPREFFDHVSSSEKIKGIGFTDGGSFLIGSVSSGIVSEVPVTSLESITPQNWKAVESQLATEIGSILVGMSRVVGYFSRMENWNSSKVAERNDRLQGLYNLPTA